jgi:hypothetical protein
MSDLTVVPTALFDLSAEGEFAKDLAADSTTQEYWNCLKKRVLKIASFSGPSSLRYASANAPQSASRSFADATLPFFWAYCPAPTRCDTPLQISFSVWIDADPFLNSVAPGWFAAHAVYAIDVHALVRHGCLRKSEIGPADCYFRRAQNLRGTT